MNRTRILAFARRRRGWLVAAVLLVAVVAAAVAALPLALRHALVAWLEDNGAQSASVEEVDVALLEARVIVSGIAARGADGRSLQLGRAAVAISLPALWERRVHLRALELADGRIDIALREDGGITVGGLAPAPADAAVEAPSRWQFGADSIAIDRMTVALSAPGGSREFSIERARIGEIAMWAADRQSSMDASVALGQARLAVSGEAAPLGPDPSVALEVAVESLDLAVAQGISGLDHLAGSLSGQLKIRAVASGGGAAVDVAGSLGLDRLAVPAGQTRLSLGRLSWQGEASYDSTAPDRTIARLGGRLALRDFASRPGTATETARSFDLGRLDAGTLNAAVTIDAARGTRIELAIADAAATAFAIRGSDPAAPPGFAAERVGIPKLDVTATAAAAFELDATGALDLQRTESNVPGARVGNGRLAWRGRIALAAGPDEALTVTLDGELDGEDLDADLAGELRALQRATHWQGTATLRRDRSRPEGALTMQASTRTEGTTIDAPKLGFRLIELGGLALDDATVGENGDVAAARLTARDLRMISTLAEATGNAAGAAAPLAAAGTLTAEGIELKNRSRLELRSVGIENAAFTLERDPNGEMRLFGFLGSLAAAFGGSAGEPRREARPFSFAVGEWLVSGDSRLTFTDRTVEPAAQIALAPLTLRMRDIDSAAPERAVPIEVSGEVGGYTELRLSGVIRPFAERIDLDLEGKLDGFELTSVSGYASEHLGYDLTRGRLDADVRVNIADGRLQASSTLVISKLSIRPTDPSRLDPLQKRLEVPLETAISLLTDANDVIRLNVPVTGDILDPQFDFSSAINTAIGNALKRTVLTTLQIAFPLGGIIMALADSGAATIQFEPVRFAAGEAGLDGEAKRYLDEVSRLLAARPAVQITVCSVATETDSAALLARAQDAARTAEERRTRERPSRGQGAAAAQEASRAETRPPDRIPREALLELAQKRSDAVKDYLVNSRGVGEARVFICAPEIDPAPAASPRAVILL